MNAQEGWLFAAFLFAIPAILFSFLAKLTMDEDEWAAAGPFVTWFWCFWGVVFGPFVLLSWVKALLQ